MSLKIFKLVFSISLLIFLQSTIKGQTLENPEPFFNAIIVNNMDTSLAWYTNNLQFEIQEQMENEERGYRVSILKTPNSMLELLELDKTINQEEIKNQFPEANWIGGLFKMGFQVNQFDQWIEKLTKAGVSFRGSVMDDPVTGKRMVIILDPDGNRVQLFEK